MNGWRRFWIGGGGALLPMLVTLLALDLASLIDHAGEFSMGTYVGAAIRYVILFVLGGIVAALNSDEVQPIKLVQLGIAAPALVASYVNAQPPKSDVPPQPRHATLDLISSAQAMDQIRAPRGTLVLAGFLADVLQGIAVPLPSIRPPNIPVNPTAPAPTPPATPNINKDASEALQNTVDSAKQAAEAAEKAAAAARDAAEQPSPENIRAVKEKANEAATAAQRAASDAKTLRALIEE